MKKQKELINPKYVLVHSKCCECEEVYTKLLSEGLPKYDALCDKCNHMENYIEVIGVTILRRVNKS